MRICGLNKINGKNDDQKHNLNKNSYCKPCFYKNFIIKTTEERCKTKPKKEKKYNIRWYRLPKRDFL